MKRLLLLAFSLLMLQGVSTAQKKIKKTPEEKFDSYTEFETQFIRVGLQGTILFKIYSYGKNEDECLEIAKMNAVKAVIFRGIPGSDLEQPLVTEAGAEEKYRDYFTAFFKKNGKYKSYVSISTDGSIDSDDRLVVGSKIKLGIAVSVQKEALRKELESAHIITKLTEGL